jgi:hypothetical protein
LDDGYAFVKRYSTDIYILNGRVYKQWAEYEWQGTFGVENITLDDPSSILISSVKNSVIQAVVRQIRQAQTSLRGMVAAGEMGENLRMMKSRSRALHGGMYNYLNSVKKLGRAAVRLRPRQLLGNIQNLWLEYSFGWAPLVSDISDGAKALSRITTYREPRVLVRYAKESAEITSQTSSTIQHGPLLLKNVRALRSRYGCKIYGAVSATPVGAVPVLDEFGFTFNEWLPTLWELTPYSFLVDYFSNVGAVIDAYSLNSLGVAWLNLGELRETSLEVVPSVTLQAPPAGHRDVDVILNSGSPFSASRRRVNRDSFAIGNLTPTLEFRIPGTSMQWLNIAALIRFSKDVSKAINRP